MSAEFAAGGCLDQIACEVVQDGDPIAIAASKCAKGFRKVLNTEDPSKTIAAKTSANIRRFCDPSANPEKILHNDAAVLGGPGANVSETVEAGDLGEWCSGFGGDGAIDDIDEWIACFEEAGTCAAQQALATKYPRRLEWLSALRGAILALEATCLGGTCTSCSDATKPEVVDACNALDSLELDIDGISVDDSPSHKFAPGTCGAGSLNSPGEHCDGSDLGCHVVAQAAGLTLDFEADPFDINCAGGYGCAYNVFTVGFERGVSPATTASAASPVYRRYCACGF